MQDSNRPWMGMDEDVRELSRDAIPERKYSDEGVVIPSRNEQLPSAPKEFAGKIVDMPASAAAKPTTDSGASASAHRNQTLFHESGDQSKTPDLTLEQTMSQAGQNLIPSIKEQFSAIGHAVTHPVETATALGRIGSGIVSKAKGAAGIEQDQKKKQEDEQIVDALWEHYKKTYFTSPQDFAKAFAKDPAAIAMDFSTIIGGVGAAAKVPALSKVATVLDPIQASLATARKVAEGTGKLGTLAQAATTKVPYQTLRDIYDIGRSGSAEQKAAFEAGRKIPEQEIIRRASDAVDQAAEAASREYLSGKGGLKNAQPNMSRVFSAIRNAENDLIVGGKVPKDNMDLYNKIQRLKSELQSYASDPSFNLHEADKYKRMLYELSYSASGRDRNVLNKIAKSVKDSIVDVDSEYANIMQKWQDWLAMSKGFSQNGASLNLSPQSAITKMLNSMKTDLKRSNSIDILSKYDADLPYLLAGYSTKSFAKENYSLMDIILSGAGWYALHHPLGALATFGSSSPRIAAGTQRAMGQAAKYGALGTSRPVSSGLYYGERGLQEEEKKKSGVSEAPPELEVINPQDSSVRSIRNNNMGNIKDTDWSRNQPGYAGSDGKFAIFDSPEAGKAAADKLLQNKGEQGINTARKLIDNWAPGAPPKYKEMVAQAAGVGIDDVIDLSDPAIRDRILAAIRWFEGDKRGSASGGRIERASGGAVGKHEKLVNRLMTLAKQAKKGEEKSTSALLAQPDEAVVKALSVAQEAI